MRIDYARHIDESAEQLQVLEKRQRGSPLADRVRMLRLLKTHAAPSQAGLAAELGYSERQVHRWWERYRHGGGSALLQRDVPRGPHCRLTAEARQALEAEMVAGRIARREDARRFLASHCGVEYRGVSRLSRLFKRYRIKPKTGRRRHRQADPAAQAAFKQ
jgi:transposase